MLAVDKRSISSRLLGVLSCSFFSVAVAQYVVPLNILSWRVIQPELEISVPGSFPSQTHLDLYDAKVIGDPLYSLNYLDQRWVAQHNFTYSTAVNGLARNTSSTWLLFNGLDTFTSISLCGYHVASTNNQFRQYTFNVTSILPSCNERGSVLNINFGSAKNIVDAIANEPDQETWPPGVEQVFEFPHRQFMRKQQSDFGWDWGPALAPAGPWLPAYIVQLQDDQIYPHNTMVDVYKQGQQNNRIPDQSQPWIVNCSIDYIGNLPEGSSMRYWFEDARGRVVVSGHLENITMQAQSITGSTLIEDDLVELWWPTGLGPQTLYILHIDITAKHHPEPIASVKRRIGFRTIVLNQEPVSAEQMAQGIAPGSHWHFEINGHEFFAKGSNFIPPDPFWPRVTESDIRTLFEAVVAANQNMLRVWSSGAYSPDFLYDVADELGILLWSEFEFGCSLYPVDQEFLDNVYEEAVYQVRRVNHHPSLAFWAGGNELENVELLLVNQTATEEDYIKYKDDYEHLFLTILFPAIFENTHSISYSPSSTSNGYTSLDFTTPPYMTQRYQNLQKDTSTAQQTTTTTTPAKPSTPPPTPSAASAMSLASTPCPACKRGRLHYRRSS